MSDPKTQNAARKCPICGNATDAAFSPFCSKRCLDIDLNRWLSGVYSVPVTENDDEDVDRVQDEEER